MGKTPISKAIAASKSPKAKASPAVAAAAAAGKGTGAGAGAGKGKAPANAAKAANVKPEDSDSSDDEDEPIASKLNRKLTTAKPLLPNVAAKPRGRPSTAPAAVAAVVVVGSKRKPTKPASESENESADEDEDENEDDDENDGSDDENSNSDDDDDEDGDGDDDEEAGSDNDDDDDDNDGSDEDEGDDEEDDEPAAKGKRGSKAPAKGKKEAVKAKPKAKTATKAKKPEKAKKASKKDVKAKDKKKLTDAKKTKSTSDKVPKNKALTKFERLEEARKAYKWWEAPELPDGINWHYLEHAGIKFAPSYVQHNVQMLYNGVPLELDAEQEEIATFYAAMPDDGPQLGNPKTREIFQKNFLDNFNEALGASKVVKDISKCDFTAIRQHLEFKKSLKKAANDEEKALAKQEKDEVQLQYGYALIDGRTEKMGNFNMEPPGLFRGRGEHPLTGSLKRRCFAENVSINVSDDACVPMVQGTPGHCWSEVRHDPSVTWLCNWQENVQDQYKYVMLAASSSFKGKSDTEKYSTAIKLKGCIGSVRRNYTAKIKSQDLADRQLGTAMWVIDALALRVGGEKGEDEADTVGCCSLRREHLHFIDSVVPGEPSYQIELEFLGKDSMLYKQTINFAQHGDIGKQVYHCLKSFCAGKQEEDDVFETLKPSILNKHLNSIMKGLTAKVFRTYNASVTLEQELPKAEDLVGLSIQDKVLQYNAANRQVAILCNHQRTISKATETMFETLNDKLKTLQMQHQLLTKWLGLARKHKEDQVPLRDDDSALVEKLQSALQSATKKKESAKTDAEKISASELIDKAKAAIKEDQQRRFNDKHMYKTTPNVASLEGRVAKWAEDIRKLEVDIRNRDENKEVALGTSKINYMDPRISVAWCKRCEVPIDKVFPKTLRDKFNWAMAVSPDWKFE